MSLRVTNTTHSCVPQWPHAAATPSVQGLGHGALTAPNTALIHCNVWKEGLPAGFLYLFPHHKTAQ